MEPVVEATDLTHTYRMGDTEMTALAGISLRVNAREFVAIYGRSDFVDKMLELSESQLRAYSRAVIHCD
jgi:hypothetical protein